MKPIIKLYGVGSGAFIAGSRCREMIISHVSSKAVRGPCIVRVSRPFNLRVNSLNKVLSQFLPDEEPVTVGSLTPEVVLPEWICERLPLLHAVLGFLRNPSPQSRLQLMVAAHLIAQFDYDRHIEGERFNGAQTFALFAHPDSWTPLAIEYLDGLRTPSRTASALDPRFLSVILFNEGVVHMDRVGDYLRDRYKLDQDHLTIEFPCNCTSIYQLGLSVRATGRRLGESRSLPTTLFEFSINEKFGSQTIYVYPREALQGVNYPMRSE